MDGHAVDGRVRVASDGNELRLGLAGRWMLGGSSPGAADVFERARRAGSEARVAVAADGDLGWDSSLLVFLRGVLNEARRRRMAVDFSGLPDGARRLLALLDATPEREDVGRRVDRPGLLGRIGTRVVGGAGAGADRLAPHRRSGVGAGPRVPRAARRARSREP